MNQAIDNCLVGLNGIGKAFCGYAAGAFVQSALLVMLLFALDLLLRGGCAPSFATACGCSCW